MAHKKVLVVDDDPDMAEVIRLILQASGYEIFSAVNCTEGMKRVCEVHPDLVVLGIMRDSTTERTLGPLRLFSADARKGYAPSGRIPLLVVTPFHSLTLRCFAEDRGYPLADDYVEKPLEPSAFVQKVERLLGE
jgi:CheY-like chemotaxis protein